MLQHAVHSVPDRSHGYCVDDNARALLLSSALLDSGETKLPEPITARLAAFIQHAWNPDTGRFRNFMSYDRKWLEDTGSEDSHARTLWALAECARKDIDPSRRRWAAALYNAALPVVETFRSPRAWAFSLLALDAFCAKSGGDTVANSLRKILAGRLMAALSAVETKDWVWFEDVLAYDNARIPQALIQTGVRTGTPAYVEAGLRTLCWLMAIQTAPLGHFRPVGSKSFGVKRQIPEAFDQQPVEAWATISACLSAWQADGRAEWPSHAMRAFGWFLGDNDLRITLVDPVTAGCADGLHPDRPNENKGAESALSYLLGLVEIRQLMCIASADETQPPVRIVQSSVSTIVPQTTSGSRFAPIPIPQPSDPISAAGSNPRRRQAVQTGD